VSAITAAEPIVTTNQVSVLFGGVAAVDSVTLEFYLGQIYGLIGPNGSGKTTLLGLLSGHVALTSGSVTFGGVKSRNRRPWSLSRAGVSRTFQNIRLVDSLTVEENIMFAADRSALVNRTKRNRSSMTLAHRIMDDLGIEGIAHEFPQTLPYGLRRRVEIARALVSDPALLLLDEPTAGMNDDERDNIAELIRAAVSPQRAIVVVEHSMALIRDVTHQIIVMNAGGVLEIGRPEEVLASAAVRQAYLGEDYDSAST
jgi:ABC-type branched-subunit amino acid transport system ATPase component